jgi:hypothetical protein
MLVEYISFTCYYMINCGNAIQGNYLQYFRNDSRQGSNAIDFNNDDYMLNGVLGFDFGKLVSVSEITVQFSQSIRNGPVKIYYGSSIYHPANNTDLPQFTFYLSNDDLSLQEITYQLPQPIKDFQFISFKLNYGGGP